MRKNEGITLIALVITIIVLLILAGISISTLTGENGILTRADESKIETRGATVEEEKNLWKADKLANEKTNSGQTITLEELLENLVRRNLLTQEEKTIIEETGKIVIGSREIVFEEKDDVIEYNEYALEMINYSSGEQQLYINFFREYVGCKNFLKKVLNVDLIEESDLSEEEMFAYATSANDSATFSERVEFFYNEGVIKSNNYTTLRELILGEPEFFSEGSGLSDVDEIIEYFWNIYFKLSDMEEKIKIYDLDGKECEYGFYEIPLQKQDYVFVAKFNDKEQKFKISIDQYEVAYYGMYDYRIIALDVVNKKRLKINEAQIIVADDPQKKLEYDIIDDQNEGENYVLINSLTEDKSIYKVKLVTDITTMEGYIQPYSRD